MSDSISQTIIDKYEQICTVIFDFFGEDAKMNTLVDLSECYEALGTIHQIIMGVCSTPTNAEEEIK